MIDSSNMYCLLHSILNAKNEDKICIRIIAVFRYDDDLTEAIRFPKFPTKHLTLM